jgi:holo-[acyl-carrier protein] synthase
VILAVGLDLVEVERVRRAWARFGERFAHRILTDAERGSLHGDPAAYLAARLAAKEAAFKALGTGWAAGVTWRQVEILNTLSGAPEMSFFGVARRLLTERGAGGVHVSLTHTAGHAAAVVVIEGDGAKGSVTR